MVTITINNNKYDFRNDLTILQACEQVNITIPRFCYHDKLSVAGNCRMCLVEVEKSPKPVASCAMPIANNMVIFTDTPLVKKAREAVLEFLLINHPLDCPICDQGGECDLQDITLNYGSDRSRFFEFKRGVEDKECGPIIKTIMTRCIHCTRCIRFVSEIAGTDYLGTLGRGENTEIGTYINKFIKTELSGNLVDLCPVGALTSKPYAFSARTWELKKFECIDFTDSLGSNIVVYTRNNMPLKHYNFKNDYENKDEIMRILPKLNDDINENWISDKTRYAFDGFKFNRLKNIKIFKEKTTWLKFLIEFNKEFNLDINKNKAILGLVGSNVNIESLFFFNQYLKLSGSNNIQINNNLFNYNIDAPCFYQFNSKLKAIDSSDLILLIGINPRYEASMLNVRIRKQILQQNITVGVVGSPANLTYKVNHLGSSTKTLIDISEGKHWFCKSLRQAKKPLIIVGNEFTQRKDEGAITNLIRFIGKKSFINLKNFNGLNYVHVNMSHINACELGIKAGPYSKLNSNNTNKFNSALLLNVNNFDKKYYDSKTTICSLNTHNLSNSQHLIKYLVPVTGHYEKNSLNLNSEGRLQKSFKSVSPNQNSRNSEDFFKVLAKLNEKTLNKNISQYFTNKTLIKENPFLSSLKSTRKQFYFNSLNIKESNNKVYLSNFKSMINNFYMTDIVTRNSQIMAECSLFLNNKTNFIKNNK